MTVDFHTHVFPQKIAAATVSALEKSGNTPAYSDGTVTGLLSQMSKAGVKISVNLPVLTKPTQFDSILKFATEMNEAFFESGKKGILSFAGIHPDTEDFEEKLLLVKNCGIKGIKIHPDYQGTFFDDERYVRILAAAKKLDLITVTHAGLDGAYVGQPIKCTPHRVMNVLDKIGGYDKLVLAHMGGNQLFSEVYDVLAGEDVYFDTAYVLQFFTQSEFMKMAEKHGCDKILFATDSPWRDQLVDLNILKGYALEEDVEKKITEENASKLLGI